VDGSPGQRILRRGVLSMSRRLGMIRATANNQLGNEFS
jgi:hypothetical protein